MSDNLSLIEDGPLVFTPRAPRKIGSRWTECSELLGDDSFFCKGALSAVIANVSGLSLSLEVYPYSRNRFEGSPKYYDVSLRSCESAKFIREISRDKSGYLRSVLKWPLPTVAEILEHCMRHVPCGVREMPDDELCKAIKDVLSRCTSRTFVITGSKKLEKVLREEIDENTLRQYVSVYRSVYKQIQSLSQQVPDVDSKVTAMWRI